MNTRISIPILTENKHFFDKLIVSLYNFKVVFLLLNFYKKRCYEINNVVDNRLFRI